MLSTNIKSEIKNLWDKFWSGGIANPLTAIEQISYLLFMKRIDELDLKRKADANFLGQKYVSIFAGVDDEDEDNEKKRWSYFKQLEGGEMLTHVQTKVFPFIKNLKNGNQVFSEHMKDAVFIIPKATLLVEAINIIDHIYDEIDKEQKEGQTFQDTQGDVYEYLLSEIAAAGKNGQFRTPRHIIQMICSLVNPKLGEEICDPACGTGGFLLGAYQHILTQHTSEQHLEKDENGIVRGLLGDKLTDERQWQMLREKTFYGYDFDTTMVRIGLMNLMLHGIDHPKIDYKDTLSKKYTEQNRFDVVMANPPFKGSIDKSDINEDLSMPTTKTELLFVNRIINMLRLGGRAGVIVPEGVLFGSSLAHKALRKMLVENCELQAVISMPSGVFKPYAGVSTAVLIFVKGGTTEGVWFYQMLADGRSLDDKREPIDKNDISDVISQWKLKEFEKNDRMGRSFYVPYEEIKTQGYDLSINTYKKDEVIIQEFESPSLILEKLESLEEEILSLESKFKRELSLLLNKSYEKLYLMTLVDVAAPDPHSIKRGPFGGALKKEIFVKDGYKVYEQKNAIQNDFEIGDYYITESKYKEMLPFSVSPDDLIISCSGTIGKIAVVPPNAKNGIINQALLKITLDQSIILPKYFKKMFESGQMKRKLYGVSRGSSIKNFPPIKVIKSIKFPVPPISIQEEIVRLIDQTENLEELHTKAANTIEELLNSFFSALSNNPASNK